MEKPSTGSGLAGSLHFPGLPWECFHVGEGAQPRGSKTSSIAVGWSQEMHWRALEHGHWLSVSVSVGPTVTSLVLLERQLLTLSFV